MKYADLRFILSLTGFMVILNLFAQDDHNYNTPLGKSLFFETVIDADRASISMNELSPLSTGMDGLTVVCHLMAQLNLMTSDQILKIMTFTQDTEENAFLEIYYQNKTIMVRRRITPGSKYYYDYNLYDPMFLATSESTTWAVHVYFTGYYLWIETRDYDKLTGNRWHAPIFFGINLPGQDYMKNYLGRSKNAKVIFGDAHPPVIFTMPDEVSVYEFNYANLKDELQNHFSNPH